MTGRRIEHERVAARACAARRMREGKLPATRVLDAYYARRRLAATLRNMNKQPMRNPLPDDLP